MYKSIFSVKLLLSKSRTVSHPTKGPPLFCTTNYLPWNGLYWDYPSCTSSGHILQLCEVLSIPVHPLGRYRVYKTFGQMDRRTDRVIPIYLPKTLFAGCTKKLPRVLLLKWQEVCEFTLSLFSFLLTMTAVICWSMKSKMVASRAGKMDATHSQVGFFSWNGDTNQPRVSWFVGWNFFNRSVTLVYQSLYKCHSLTIRTIVECPMNCINKSFFWQNITLLKIFIGKSAKLVANGHVQIYNYTEYGQWPNKSFEHNCKL